MSFKITCHFIFFTVKYHYSVENHLGYICLDTTKTSEMNLVIG